MLDRRSFLAGTALVGAAAALPLGRAAFAQAAATAAPAVSPAQAPAFHRIRVGDAIVTALSDGSLQIPAEALSGATPEEVAQRLAAAFLPEGPYTAPINAYLVETGDRTVLIDGGAPAAFAPTVGKLLETLAAAEVAPETVDTILLTHLHPDHVGQLIDAAGAVTFPNAELVARAEEVAFWTDAATRAALPPEFVSFFDLANAVLGAYQGRVTTFDADSEVAPGITGVFLPGHTPGHTGFRVTGGDESLLIWGDIVHVAPVQLPDPRVTLAFDVAPETAAASRLRVLDEVATDRTMVAGMHMPFPGFAHLAREGEGYALVPVPWQFSL
jgi:glyoxylase-like metal-dependent hydrolase (beta-lactamase superfamily II)